MIQARKVACRQKRQRRPRQRRAQGGAEYSSGDCNHEALDQYLTQDCAARSAQCRADRKFPLAFEGPRQQQVRNIGASDQKHESDGGKYQREEAVVSSEQIGLKRRDNRTPSEIARMGGSHMRRNDIHVGLCLSERDSVFETRIDEVSPKHEATFCHRIPMERNP